MKRNFFPEIYESPMGYSIDHKFALSDLAGILFNGQIKTEDGIVLDSWISLPVSMRGFWGARLREEVWDMSKYTANPSEIRIFIADIKNGKKTNDAIFKFKMLVNSRLGV